jgi:hypothetical protein
MLIPTLALPFYSFHFTSAYHLPPRLLLLLISKKNDTLHRLQKAWRCADPSRYRRKLWHGSSGMGAARTCLSPATLMRAATGTTGRSCRARRCPTRYTSTRSHDDGGASEIELGPPAARAHQAAEPDVRRSKL